MESTSNEDTNICPSEEPINKNITINILTRSGNRPTYFKTLKDSILTQTYPYIRHLISNDNPECNYLTEDKYVYAVSKPPSRPRGFYNLYLNELAAQVEDGWVIILDDDSKLIDNTFIEKLAEICSTSNENDVLIYQTIIEPDKRVVPSSDSFINKINKCGDIDMVCFCVHYSIFNNIQFKCQLGGDFLFIGDIENSKQYNFKYIEQLPKGLWGNYDGPKNGN
jgi:hypothetical protein